MIWCRACGCLASQLLAVSGLGDSAFGAAGGGGDIPAGGARRGSQGERAGGGWHGGQRWADDVKRWVWAPKSCADCSGRWDRCEETAGSFKCLPCDSAAECGLESGRLSGNIFTLLGTWAATGCIFLPWPVAVHASSVSGFWSGTTAPCDSACASKTSSVAAGADALLRDLLDGSAELRMLVWPFTCPVCPFATATFAVWTLAVAAAAVLTT